MTPSNGDKSDFHAVEKPHNLTSMAWKNREFDFHAVEVGHGKSRLGI
jgi:hypothetical protein